jgi:RNA polymerase sigma factor (sigma-70 family)
MPEESFDSFLEQFNSRDPEEAWRLFLEEYSTTILNVVRHIEHDSETVPDCFQFVCERLSADSFRRLKKFRAGGPAVFSTWLRAVVRNLCLDWRRKQFGRHRSFKSISRLSGFDQEVFRHLYERPVSFEEAFESLRSTFPNLTHTQLTESTARIDKELTTRQRRLLDAQHSSLTSPARVSWGETDPAHDVQDPAPSPEAQAVAAQKARALRRALANLPQRDRLLIRLRFEQELTLEQVAKLMDLGNAQRVERQIKAVLMQLRKELE